MLAVVSGYLGGKMDSPKLTSHEQELTMREILPHSGFLFNDSVGVLLGNFRPKCPFWLGDGRRGNGCSG
jgi:hypothetical protein